MKITEKALQRLRGFFLLLQHSKKQKAKSRKLNV
jgi:hypothetical protein